MNRCKVIRTLAPLFAQVADPFAPSSAPPHPRPEGAVRFPRRDGRPLFGVTGAPDRCHACSTQPPFVAPAPPGGSSHAGPLGTGVIGMSPAGRVSSLPPLPHRCARRDRPPTPPPPPAPPSPPPPAPRRP